MGSTVRRRSAGQRRRFTLAAAALLATAVGGPAGASENDRRLREAQARHEADQEARAAQVRRDRQRRLSAMGVHARMRSTMYASTPSPPDTAPHCPVLRDEPPEDVYDRIIRARRGDVFQSSSAAPAAAREFAAPQQTIGRLSAANEPPVAPAHGPARAVAASTAATGTQARSGAAIGDLDGDGSDDVVLRRADGRWRYYAMDGRRHVAARSGALGIPADPAWAFAGIGDLNGDGRADILSRHPDGRWRYHAMDGKDRLAAESGEPALPADPAWRLAGVGDFDGDGFDDDVLLRHADTNRWRYLPMDGRAVADGEGAANLTANPSWTVAGIGDLNGDGRDDVLLRHADTSRWYYYPMDGRTVLDGRGTANLSANGAWTFAGIGDLNGDGRDDVLLRHADTSRWYYYPMDGRAVAGGKGSAALSSNAAWAFAGMGDLDGDGTTDDVLLRRSDTGRWHYSPMSGRTAGGGKGSANLTPDPAWRPAGAVAADVAYRDCPACPRMVDVPAGSYARGSPSAEALRSTDEGPRRRVAFAEPFALGETETTYAEWQACVDGGGCGGHVPAGAAEASGGRPVVDVTWAQARSYADWLSARTGEPYRLPSEAEWEYAARAGTATPFHTGATISTEQANYDGTLPPYGGGVAGVFRGATVAAGAFPPNAFGLRDMHGNAAEWTADCHAPDYRNAPTDGSAAETADCTERVLRGGSWRDGPEELRSANRTAAAEGWHGGTAGFRVAKDISVPPDGGETAEDVFRASVSPVVQSKCVNCHVEGGASGHTPLVFVTDADADHLAKNLKAFEDYVAAADGGAERILNKAQGVEHGGGVQLAAGTEGFAALERFLGLLGGDASPGSSVSVATLFDGVRMEPARSTLRRAAIVFAGRIPTEAEYASIESGGLTSLRKAIRGLMTGPGFHDFLIRSANDRLLTDRHLDDYTIGNDGFFVDFDNEFVRLNEIDSYGREHFSWESKVQYGAGRAPLELIAHVAENDLPYTEVLTAPYIMANPWAAEAYGAATEFADSTDMHEFRASEIARYYRNCDGKETEFSQANGLRVLEPGPCATDYPHAGLLNTTVFLKRYPTTATNRNRARSRWTYYHFVGLDVEKSASRTTDPVALADTNNPTMNNPACTVCHQVLDPVAGAFQNYGDEGNYRDQWGGKDSLDDLYKEGAAPVTVEVEAETYEARETVSATVRLSPGGLLAVQFANDHWDDASGADRNLFMDRLVVRHEEGGDPIFAVELETLTEEDLAEGDCGLATEGTHFGFYSGCRLRFDVGVPVDGAYRVEAVAWADQYGDELAQVAFSDLLYREGDTWYRDMREPGFDREHAPDARNGLQWLAGRIVADPRFAESTVGFWWPAVMGADVVEPPAEGDADFEGRLLASNAQAAEVARLGGAFRRGFGGGMSYNLKDLLAEIALSKWFRAHVLTDRDPVRAVALAYAGANRLLTPEELARKTAALTGFDWRRYRPGRWDRPGDRRNWANTEYGYGLLYGGIDSDGIVERGRDLTSVMAGVAKRHASVASCPVVMKDFYLAGDRERRLFNGMDVEVSPIWEDIGEGFDVPDRQWRTSTFEAELGAGRKIVSLMQRNGVVWADRLAVRNAAGRIVAEFEFETLGESNCGQPWPDLEPGYFAFWCGSLDVAVDIPIGGTYEIEVTVYGEPDGDDTVEASVGVFSSDVNASKGARAIKAKLAELHDRLLGVAPNAASADVQAAYDLFVDVWRRGRESDDGDFRSLRCVYHEDQHYFDGIADDIWRDELDEHGDPLGWDWERMDEFIWEENDMPDPNHVVRTWVVVLAYLMTDPRYLHL